MRSDWRRISPSGAEAPVDGTDDQPKDDCEHNAHCIVLGEAPVGERVLPQNESDLLQRGARVLAVKMEGGRPLLGMLQLAHHLANVPASHCAGSLRHFSMHNYLFSGRRAAE